MKMYAIHIQKAALDKLNLFICWEALSILRVTILEGLEVCITILYYNFQTYRNVISS